MCRTAAPFLHAAYPAAVSTGGMTDSLSSTDQMLALISSQAGTQACVNIGVNTLGNNRGVPCFPAQCHLALCTRLEDCSAAVPSARSTVLQQEGTKQSCNPVTITITPCYLQPTPAAGSFFTDCQAARAAAAAAYSPH